jgi:hypothetical protein
VKLVGKLMIALLLVAFVGQASASFFAVCNTSDTNTSTHSLIKLNHVTVMVDATAEQLSDCEQGHCACQEHACSNIFSLASTQ